MQGAALFNMSFNVRPG